MDEHFFDELMVKYPDGSSRLENEVSSLKRKLNETDINESSEEIENGANSEIRENSKKRKTKERQNVFSCAECGKTFSKKQYLNRHFTTHTKIKCNLCDLTFSRADSLKRHVRNKHDRKQFPCPHCDRAFQTYTEVFDHVQANHPMKRDQNNKQRGGQNVARPQRILKNIQHGLSQQSLNENINVGNHKQPKKRNVQQNKETSRSGQFSGRRAINGSAEDFIIYPRDEEIYDLLLFFANKKLQIEEHLKSRLRQYGIKWYLSTQVEMVKESPEGVVQTDSPHFRSLTYSDVSVEAFSEHSLNEAFQKMSASLESYTRNSSGWNIRKVIELTIHSIRYSPLSGSSYIELPSTLKISRSLLNIRNEDQKCFLYCILASLHVAPSCPELVQNYREFESELDMTGIDYPVSITSIDKFERQNQNISVNVFAFVDNDIVPLKITKRTDRLHHVDLLLLKNKTTSHYCLIRNLNRFLSRTKTTRKQQFFCPYCLHGFNLDKLLKEHIVYCSTNEPQKVTLPDSGKNDMLEYKEFDKQLKVPFVIYADFETLNTKLQTCIPNPSMSSTTQTTLLEPCSFAYKVVCINEKYTKPTVIFRGPDASQKLIESLVEEQHEIEEILKHVDPIQMTEADEKAFANATRCVLCQKSFDITDTKVRHHLHFGMSPEKDTNMVGAAHQKCNLLAKQANFIPVIFHNLRNFDGHIILQSLGLFKETDIKCIPQNLERYISFSLGKLRFIDSFQFLPSSLETLVEDLVSEGDDAFQYFWKEFTCDEAKLLLRKGVYPYEYMDHVNRFQETKLPPIKSFYSSIKGEGISESDYEHALEVFQRFKLNNLGDYHDLYLKTDVVLLCDVFERFRNMCLQKYGLDACHFFSSPGLSWTACLKMTGVCLELLTDIDMINFFEKGTRGGISQISNRYKRANNPLLGEKFYDKSSVSSFISYLDMNNLYGLAMSKPIATGGFRFLNKDEIQQLDILSTPKDSSIGYVCEVSLEYPKELHDRHSDYPLAPEKKIIKDQDLSPYAKRLWKAMHGRKETDELPPRAKVEKLITSLNDKEKYILHYHNLQLYIQLGMRIQQIHRVLEFNQEPWMKPYIEFNTVQRKQATSLFQKNFYKLMNCSVFGK